MKTEVVKSELEVKLDRLQESGWYRTVLVILDLACGIGAVAIIQNKQITVFLVQLPYLLFAALPTLDAIAILYIKGISKNRRNFLVWSEIISGMVILPLSAIMLTYNSQQDVPVLIIKLWGIFCILKFVRLIYYLARFEQVALTIRVFYQIMPFLWSFLGMLTIIFFFFATIGMNLFGGRVTNKTPAIYQQKTGLPLSTNYHYINFNDIPSSILALYVNVINNNWIYFTNMFILSDNDDRLQHRWFFVIFQLVTNLFVMTILVGFIIDNILQQFEIIVDKEVKLTNIQLKNDILEQIGQQFNIGDDKGGKLLVNHQTIRCQSSIRSTTTTAKMIAIEIRSSPILLYLLVSLIVVMVNN